MALATQADVEARLGRALTEAEAGRLPSLLDDASALVIGFTGQDFEPAPYPDPVVGVVTRIVARILTMGDSVPAFAEQQAAGPFSVRFSAGAASGDVWLSKADRMALRPYRLGGGLTSVQVVGERYTITPDTTA